MSYRYVLTINKEYLTSDIQKFNKDPKYFSEFFDINSENDTKNFKEGLCYLKLHDRMFKSKFPETFEYMIKNYKDKIFFKNEQEDGEIQLIKIENAIRRAEVD